MPRTVRARDLGVRIGRLPPGPDNAITDVAGVRVGHATIVRGEGQMVAGSGPVRTGVTVVVPPGVWERPLFAGAFTLNGNGEMTGLAYLRDAGLLRGPVAITNTHSVGAVHEALIAIEREKLAVGELASAWSLPVVAETWDGVLNDVDGFHVRAEHVRDALAAAVEGPVAEGNVGGGTGMICHQLKGGIGTSSRILGEADGAHVVGVLVQANYGRRERLTIAGVPVGEEIPLSLVPAPTVSGAGGAQPARSGSIIVVAATDAPLLPHQCRRLAMRCALGIGRVGGAGEPTSGDLIMAFATGNPDGESAAVRAIPDGRLGPLFWAAVEATEEAIVNALVAARTMTGRDGNTAFALPHDLLVQALARYARR